MASLFHYLTTQVTASISFSPWLRDRIVSSGNFYNRCIALTVFISRPGEWEEGCHARRAAYCRLKNRELLRLHRPVTTSTFSDSHSSLFWFRKSPVFVFFHLKKPPYDFKMFVLALRVTSWSPLKHVDKRSALFFFFLLPICLTCTIFLRSPNKPSAVANRVLTSNTSQSETLLNIDPFF